MEARHVSHLYHLKTLLSRFSLLWSLLALLLPVRLYPQKNAFVLAFFSQVHMIHAQQGPRADGPKKPGRARRHSSNAPGRLVERLFSIYLPFISFQNRPQGVQNTYRGLRLQRCYYIA
jgi:hypothetical protein